MAWTIQLLDATTTVDLNDGSSYRTTFLSAPTPALRASFAGAGNPFRAGRFWPIAASIVGHNGTALLPPLSLHWAKIGSVTVGIPGRVWV